MSTEETTILLTGYAPAPKGTVMQDRQRLFGIILEVDLATQTILRADVPGVTDLSRDFFQRIAVGYDLSGGIDKLCETVRARYWTASTESLVACLKMIWQRYEDGHKRLRGENVAAAPSPAGERPAPLVERRSALRRLDRPRALEHEAGPSGA